MSCEWHAPLSPSILVAGTEKANRKKANPGGLSSPGPGRPLQPGHRNTPAGIHSSQEVPLLSSLLLGIKLPHLGAIAALLHAAPAPVVILAGVEEKPLAGRRGAGAHQRHIARGEQIAGRARDRPQHRLARTRHVIEAP